MDWSKEMKTANRNKKARERRRTRVLTRHQADNKRMAVLATELAMAGAQVLQEDFGFNEQMTNTWIQKMVARAEANRDKALQDPPKVQSE
jgi:hypothetical protein